MKLAVFTDALADRPLADALAWMQAEVPAVRLVEVGTGAFSPAPHCDLTTLLRSQRRRQKWLAEFDACGIGIAAFNVSGNPLHPHAVWARRDDAALRATIRLAAMTGVNRIVAMSGCPAAGPGRSAAPHFVAGGWLPDFEGFLQWQWQEKVLPYWRALSEFAASEHPDLRICFELHPGACVYNGPTYDWIKEAGGNLLINLDPSHFFWQGIDPLAFAKRYGSHVGFVHGKDTTIMHENAALTGMLDCRIPGEPSEMAWNFSTVGRAHDGAWWADFLAALSDAGYDGTISIEYEDPFLAAEPAIVEGVAVLTSAISTARRA